MSNDSGPTISALQRRGHEVVAHLLAANESHWESPSEADRDRVEALAHSVAARLLQEPACRLETSRGEASLEYDRALRELFGLCAQQGSLSRKAG
jgi:glutamyl-tRNA reductase